MTLLQHLNEVSQERGFDTFIQVTMYATTTVIKAIIEEAGNRFKNDK